LNSGAVAHLRKTRRLIELAMALRPGRGATEEQCSHAQSGLLFLAAHELLQAAPAGQRAALKASVRALAPARLLGTHLDALLTDKEDSPCPALPSDQSAMVIELFNGAIEKLLQDRVGFWPRGLIRLGATIVLLALLVQASQAALAYSTQPENLLDHAQFTTSSRYLSLPVKDMLFHTDDETNPSVNFDFGQPVLFSHLVIENTENLQERAIPLIVELSLDGKTYRQIGKREQVFATWSLNFPTAEARFVRLRVPRRTWLHLKRVGAYR
jgi:hypothetical protein